MQKVWTEMGVDFSHSLCLWLSSGAVWRFEIDIYHTIVEQFLSIPWDRGNNSCEKVSWLGCFSSSFKNEIIEKDIMVITLTPTHIGVGLPSYLSPKYSHHWHNYNLHPMASLLLLPQLGIITTLVVPVLAFSNPIIFINIVTLHETICTT